MSTRSHVPAGPSPVPSSEPNRAISDPAAERRLLAAAIVQADVRQQLCIHIRLDDFADPLHRKAISVLAAQRGEQPDLTTAQLEQLLFAQREFDAAARVSDVVNEYRDAISLLEARTLISGLHELATRRTLMAVGHEVIAYAADPGDVSTFAMLDRIERRIIECGGASLNTRGVGCVNAADEVGDTLHELQASRAAGGVLGFPTGLPTLDAVTQGIHTGQITCLTGPGQEEAHALLLSICEQALAFGGKVLYFTPRQAMPRLLPQILAFMSRVPLLTLRGGPLSAEQVTRLDKAAAVVREGALWICDHQEVTPNAIRWLARGELQAGATLATGKINLIVVDDPDANPSNWARETDSPAVHDWIALSCLAKELQCAVVIRSEHLPPPTPSTDHAGAAPLDSRIRALERQGAMIVEFCTPDAQAQPTHCNVRVRGTGLNAVLPVELDIGLNRLRELPKAPPSTRRDPWGLARQDG